MIEIVDEVVNTIRVSMNVTSLPLFPAGLISFWSEGIVSSDKHW